VNLLLASQKHSREPGDSLETVASRARFLDGGHYAPLAERLVQTVGGLTADRSGGRVGGEPLDVLDSGCGEGYFLARLREGAAKGGIVARFWGIDVSKPAIRAAARRDRALGLAVASVHRLPVASSRLDLVLRVLAPIDAAEFRRVLAPSGRLLCVTPGPDHLFALRRLVYETPRPLSSEPPPEGFSLVWRDRLTFPVNLSSAAELLDLLAMTPYYWHTNPEARQAIAREGELETSADFELALYLPEGLG
jgi:23S rRNA (guanine745-N1)-methyltransferase